MTTVLLARHGQTDWNRERIWQGQADPPLNELGREQAATLAASLEVAPAAVYSSDLARARETAEIVAGRFGLPVRLDPRLREVDVGELSGQPILTAHGSASRTLDYVAAELGDAFDEMQRRVGEALREIGEAGAGEHVLVVTHGGPIAAAWVAAGGVLGERPRVGNCDVQPYRVEGGTITRID